MLWETDFLKYIIDNFHNDTMTIIMSVITTIGNYGFIWILTALILLLFKKTRWDGITMSVSLIMIFIIVNILIKPMLDRARPFEVSDYILNSILITLPKDSSFPSGHTASAFAASTAVFCRNRKLGIPLIILAVLIGLSRLYFAVHFPTDVICGMIIGIIVGIFSFKISAKKEKTVDKGN